MAFIYNFDVIFPHRLRLKRDFDDFKKHPDYDNFVREEWVAEDVDRSTGDNTRLTEEEERQQQDQTVQRILWTGGKLCFICWYN